MKQELKNSGKEGNRGSGPEFLSSFPTSPRPFTLRAGQKRFHRFVDQHRLAAFLARRQYGKTTTLAGIALKKMMRTRGHTIIFGSAKLSLSREIVRKEAEIMRAALESMRKGSGKQLELTEAGRPLPTDLSADDFAGIFEAQRLEFRFHSSNNASDYSRTKVVALLPDTVGETGDLMLDEVGRVKNFREVWEAVQPIAASNPDFRVLITTTPPPDDMHYSFELLSPPIGSTFHPHPAGNTYRSELGVHVLRVDAFDAALDGVPLYDDESGAPITPEEHRRRSHDKDAWDRNYGVRFLVGGTAACGLVLLQTAQERGIGNCACFVIDDDAGFDAAIKWLAEHITANKIGIGVDWATTTNALSNPTAVAVVEREGASYIVRCVFVWKTADPDLATERLTQIVRVINDRPAGGRVRRLCQDATNERYHCRNITKALRGLVPVENIVSSETVEMPGGESITKKQLLGSQYVGELEDNHLTLPPERYIREDHRLPKREKGTFACEPDASGRHGDTFDAGKLGLHALIVRSSQPDARPMMVGSFEGGMA